MSEVYTRRFVGKVAHTYQPLAGFTAIEVSAVATIIAILALILIPIVRNRVNEARLVAAQNDMASIEKAQSMAFGFTGNYFRLFELDNPTPNQDIINSAPGTEEALAEINKMPKATWNIPGTPAFLPGFQTRMLSSWSGPYLSSHNTLTPALLLNDLPYLFRSDTVSGALGGPILLTNKEDLNIEQCPVDPWGLPYVFFGPTPVRDLGGAIAFTGTESNFGTPVVYSMGPNNVAGNDFINGTDPANYFRETGVLGTGDDLTRSF